MLLAHPVPNYIIVRQTPPAFADLGRMAKGCGVKVGEDTEGDFGRGDGQEIDPQ